MIWKSKLLKWIQQIILETQVDPSRCLLTICTPPFCNALSSFWEGMSLVGQASSPALKAKASAHLSLTSVFLPFSLRACVSWTSALSTGRFSGASWLPRLLCLSSWFWSLWLLSDLWIWAMRDSMVFSAHRVMTSLWDILYVSISTYFKLNHNDDIQLLFLQLIWARNSLGLAILNLHFEQIKLTQLQVMMLTSKGCHDSPIHRCIDNIHRWYDMGHKLIMLVLILYYFTPGTFKTAMDWLSWQNGSKLHLNYI